MDNKTKKEEEILTRDDNIIIHDCFAYKNKNGENYHITTVENKKVGIYEAYISKDGYGHAVSSDGLLIENTTYQGFLFFVEESLEEYVADIEEAIADIEEAMADKEF